jgi:hypothetical protein
MRETSDAAPPDAVFMLGNPGSTADWTRLVASMGEFDRTVAMICRVSALRTAFL